MKNLISITSLLIFFLACESEQTGDRIDTNSLKTGAEKLIEDGFESLVGKNVAIITNHTATVGDRHIADILHEAEEVNVVSLFGPEHGIRGDAPAGDPIDFELDEITGLPVHSLYGDVRKPTPEMLEGIDVLIFDIQDIGPRFYTYISTMGKGMEAAADLGITFMVLDRPNPLGGELVEGHVREEGFESFVGYFPIPVTHGLTIGELAIMAKEEGMLDDVEDLDLHVIQMENWSRDQLWPELGLEWNPPSPNIPDFETALIYPGACYFEGLSASEGRGTMEPFILLGAPWADGEVLAEDLNARNLPGLQFEPAEFTPEVIPHMATRPKHLGEQLQGIRYVVTDMHLVRPVEAGMHMIHAFYKQVPVDEEEAFFTKERIGRLAGTDRVHNMFRDGASAEDVIASWEEELAEYDAMRRQYHLYN
ncbi:DUF1343 domain-containing protein [soil metagenome]